MILLPVLCSFGYCNAMLGLESLIGMCNVQPLMLLEGFFLNGGLSSGTFLLQGQMINIPSLQQFI